MAGHFLNSELSNDGLFCKTDDAPISPRVSFSINFLLKSKKVIIVAMDESKKAALKFYAFRKRHF